MGGTLKTSDGEFAEIAIRKLRKRLGETRAEFGRRFGVKEWTITKWEMYYFPNNAEHLAKLEQLLAEYPE
jgi:DNA-binding transcriptional regulator YiaG